ncbi:hypothetical protein AZE42_11455 [Rhizopogon vesiculosus]|uniref:Uncharacterized protein n=1 Tax=Rhizopogon vesiculosus TaxID=180088 RepID=A0A1J8R244_9AGAM|nr:hypothetical protein AZE42_11455 [Rhizopogon vesiculosus]
MTVISNDPSQWPVINSNRILKVRGERIRHWFVSCVVVIYDWGE